MKAKRRRSNLRQAAFKEATMHLVIFQSFKGQPFEKGLPFFLIFRIREK